MPQPHSTGAPPSYGDASTYPPSSAAPSKPQPPSAPSDYSSYAPSYAKPVSASSSSSSAAAAAASSTSPANYPPRQYYPPNDFAYPPSNAAKPPPAEYYGRSPSAAYPPSGAPLPPPYGNRPNFAPYASTQSEFDASRTSFARAPQRPFPAGDYPYPYPAGSYPQPSHSSFSHGKEPDARAPDPPRKGRFDAFPPAFPASLEKPCVVPRF